MKKQLLVGIIAFVLASSAFALPTNIWGDPDSGDELFTFTDTDGTNDDSTFLTEFAWGQLFSTERFGLYQYDSGSDAIVNSLVLFDENDWIGSSSVVSWDLGAETASNEYGSIDISLADYAFGLFYEVDGDTYYSQSDLNAGGTDHFSFHWDDDNSTIHDLHVYAEDDGTNIFTRDFIEIGIDDVTRWVPGDDVVVVNVPTPGGIALLSLGLFGMGFARRILS